MEFDFSSVISKSFEMFLKMSILAVVSKTNQNLRYDSIKWSCHTLSHLSFSKSY